MLQRPRLFWQARDPYQHQRSQVTLKRRQSTVNCEAKSPQHKVAYAMIRNKGQIEQSTFTGTIIIGIHRLNRKYAKMYFYFKKIEFHKINFTLSNRTK